MENNKIVERDIFEVLKHNDHKLEVITDQGEVKLGCIDCGETLFDYTKGKIELDFELLIRTIKISKEKAYNNLFDSIRDFVSAKLDEITKKLTNDTNIERRINHKDKTGILMFKMNVIDMIREELYIARIQVFEELIELLDVAINVDIDKIKTAYDNFITADGFKDNKYDHLALHSDLGRRFVIANHTYQINHPGLMVFQNLIATDEREEENPTNNEETFIQSINHYYDLMPDWEDEEDDNYAYNNWIYRLDKDLIKLDELNRNDLIKLLKGELSYFFDYEYVNRKTSSICAILKALNIDISEPTSISYLEF